MAEGTLPPVLPPVQVRLGGLLGEAVEASRRGRLSRFIVDEHSAPIRLFDPALADRNTEGDWYGEHAGKWLVAAARAAARSGDAALARRVQRVARWLAAQQRPDGYLGTYAAARRFTAKQPPKPITWDGAPALRTWDVWVHAYLVLGLLEVHAHWPDERLLNAAARIGGLCQQVLDSGTDITELGNHHGLSATVFLEPAVALYEATREGRFLALAQRILEQADGHPPLRLLQQALAGADPSEIATGKAYQLQWNLVGLARLHRATGREDLLRAVRTLWQAIREHHLTLGGGPWGGVAHRSREVFNPRGVFSPQGYVETCSTLSWIQLNRELLAITGDPAHAEEIERAACNDLLGALAPDGEDWCYYVFPNGRRVHTTRWRCCKSSGAMALEELPPLAVQRSAADEISVQLLGPATATVPLAGAGEVQVEIEGRYPFDGAVALRLRPACNARFTLRVRIPGWAEGAQARLGEQPLPVQAGRYLVLQREWAPGDTLHLQLPMVPRLHRRASRNVQESRAPDGAAVRQEVLHQAYVAVTRGPLVYASGLVDGFKTEETLQLPDAPDTAWLQALPDDAGDGPSVRLAPASRPPLRLAPYYRAGGRVHGAWRLTWFGLAPDGAPPFTEEPSDEPADAPFGAPPHA